MTWKFQICMLTARDVARSVVSGKKKKKDKKTTT
jgi:hypothetical protein